MVVYTGRTVEQAIEKGLNDLNLSRMKAHIKVIAREKKGFLGFGKKPARVSVDPINEKTAHKADQNAVKGVPDAINQQNAPVTSRKEDAVALNKVTKLAKAVDETDETQTILQTPVVTEQLVEEVVAKVQGKPKATVISLDDKREQNGQKDQPLEPATDDFEAFISTEFDSVEESTTEDDVDIQEAVTAVLAYLDKIIYEMDVDATLDSSYNRRNIVIQIETDQPGRVIGYHGKVLKALQLLGQNFIHDRYSKRFSIVLNVRDYLEQRTETLNELAEKTAMRVLETGEDYIMDPMSNTERKIVHKAISRLQGVDSYSEGDDPNRYVVVTVKS